MLANVLVGFALFGSVYILPQYLGQAQGYNAEQIGNVLAWTGLPQLLLIPLVPLLMRRFDARYVGFVGVGIFAVSSFMNVAMSPDVAGDQLLLPNIVRAIGQALVLTPVSAITTAGIAPSEAGAASGLSNMLRNLGGAVGTATLATVLTKREQYHSNVIGQSVTIYREEVRTRIADATNYFLSHGVSDPAAAQHQGRGLIGQDRAQAGAGDGLRRHVRRHWRRACHRRRRVAVRQKGAGGRWGRGSLRQGRRGLRVARP